MSSPKVSVIIPVHNAEKYLEQCLSSILGQTLKDIEVICVDDNSTDGSTEILERFSKEDSRLRVLQSPSLGAGGARNIGLASAQGEYLSFLDADDFFEPDMLESAVAKAEEDQSDIVVYGSWLYDAARQANRQAKWKLQLEGLPEGRSFAPTEVSDRIFSIFGNEAWNKLFRTSRIQEKGLHFQEISRANDLYFTCAALVQSRSISVIDRAFVHYRVATTTSLQSTKDRDPVSFLTATEALHSYLKSNGLLAQYQESFINHLLDCICWNIASVHTQESIAHIKDEVCGSIEPEYQLLGQNRSLVHNQAQLDEYESLLCDDMPTFLFKRTVVLQSQLEDSYWHTDWCDWKKWTLENEAESQRLQIEALGQKLAAKESEIRELKSLFVVRTRDKLLKLKSQSRW